MMLNKYTLRVLNCVLSLNINQFEYFPASKLQIKCYYFK